MLITETDQLGYPVGREVKVALAVKLSAQVFADRYDVLVAYVVPSALFSQSLERVGNRAPTFFGRLEAVALVSFDVSVFEEPLAHLRVVFQAGSSWVWQFSCHGGPACPLV